MNEAYKRLAQFVERCEDEEVNAVVIRDAWLSERITLIEANQLAHMGGIAGPLAYWTK